MRLRQALLASLLVLAAAPVLACYTVYDRNGRVVYNESRPPVDMSLPIHETLPARFPGGHMVFDSQTDCASVSTVPPIAAPGGGAPLLTDRKTAEAMNMPYTALPGGIVIVQPRDARLGAGLTVVPAAAGRAQNARSGGGAVITELRNPPVTIVETRDGVAIGESSRR